MNPAKETPPKTETKETSPGKHPWLPFLLPLLVYMLISSLEPTAEEPGGGAIGLAIPYAAYPIIYSIKIVLTLISVALAWPGLRNLLRSRITLWGFLFGGVGAVVWIGLCELRLESHLLVPLGVGGWIEQGVRPAFNPLEQLACHPLAGWSFLAVRFLGLVLVVPLIEEVFLRGFAMRFVQEDRWWEVPLGKVTVFACLVGTLIPMMLHPGELFAAAVWFSMITVLMVKTRSLLDCIVAHAVTNLLLGIYVLIVGGQAWRLL